MQERSGATCHYLINDPVYSECQNLSAEAAYMSASPATPSSGGNVDNIGPPAAKRPKPQTTPPSHRSPGQQGGSPGVNKGGAPNATSGVTMGGGGGSQFRLQPVASQQSPNFLCNPSTSLSDLPETSTELIDDLCSALPPDVFSSHAASPALAPGGAAGGQQSSAGGNRPGSTTVLNQSTSGTGVPNTGIETQHPNLTGLLTNSSLSDQDFSASLSFNGPSSLMAHNTTSQYGFQQQQSHSNSSGVPASYSNISQQQQQTSVQQNLPPQGPNSSANNPQVVTNNAPQGAPQNAQQSSNPAPFSHQIIISSQQGSGVGVGPGNNFITINPGVTMATAGQGRATSLGPGQGGQANPLPSHSQGADPHSHASHSHSYSHAQMQSNNAAAATFYQAQNHMAKLGEASSAGAMPEVIHVQTSSGVPLPPGGRVVSQSTSSTGAGGGGMQINMNLTQNINTGTTIINMTPAAAPAPSNSHHPSTVTSQSMHSMSAGGVTQGQMNGTMSTVQSGLTHTYQQQQSNPQGQQPSPQVTTQYVTTNSSNQQIQMAPAQGNRPIPNQNNNNNNSVNSAAAAANNSADANKRKLIQQQLILLLHAHKCQKQDPKSQGPESAKCKLPHCSTMKNVLQHLYVCQEGKSCRVAHCSSSRQIITHWKNCNRPECPVCYPLKAHDGNGGSGAKKPGGLPMGAGVMASPNSHSVTSGISLGTGGPLNDNSAQMTQTGQFIIPGQSPAHQQQTSGSQIVGTGMRPAPGTMMQNGPRVVSRSVTENSQFNNSIQIISGGPGTGAPGQGFHQIVGNQPVGNQQHQGAGNFQNPGNAQIFIDVRKAGQMNQRGDVTMQQHQQQRPGITMPGGQQMMSNANSNALQIENMDNNCDNMGSMSVQTLNNPNTSVVQGNVSGTTISPSVCIQQNPNAPSSGSGGSSAGNGSQPQTTSGEQNQYLMTVLKREGVIASTVHKEWHEQVKENVRCLLVYKLVETILPNTDLLALQDRRVDNFIGYAKRVEIDMYDTAENKEDYFLRLAQKIYRIQKEIDDKRQQKQNERNQQQQQQQLGNLANSGDLGSQQFQTQPPQHNNMMVQRNNSGAPFVSATPNSNDNRGGGQGQPLQGMVKPKVEVKMEPSGGDLQMTSSGMSSTNSGGGGPNNLQPQGGQFPTSLENLLGKGRNTPQPSHIQMQIEPTSSSQTIMENSGSGVKDEPTTMETDSAAASRKSSVCSVTIKEEIKQEVKTEPGLETVKRESSSSSSSGSGSSGQQQVQTAASTTPTCKSAAAAPSSSSSSPSVGGSVGTAKNPRNPKTFTKEELNSALWPALQRLFMQEMDAQPFRLPVDPILLGIPDYFSIIKHPMDLSTIRRNLEEGKYLNPWGFIDDVQLMFNNARLYNRKNTRVYKSCIKLSEVFDSVIDEIMEKLGYCCGHTYVFLPQMLYCYSKNSCPIPKDAKYYQWNNKSPRPGLISDKYLYCSKCFQDGDPNKMTVTDEPMVPNAYSVHVDKGDFEELVNNKVEAEPFVTCIECGRKWHQICALYHENIWPTFTCEPCLKQLGVKKKDNKFIAQKLPSNKLSVFLESRINKFTKAREPHCGYITIRVLSSSEKAVDAKMGLKSKHPEFPSNFPYKSKAIFAFETIDATDICFFGMHVQEYGSECDPPNKRHVYLSYLDSVHYFQPKTLRTAVYHEILINYLDYCKQLGYSHAHIWACPPGEGDDYIFHCHPPDQKIPKPKRLQDWYKKMMDKAIHDRVIYEYKDIMKSVEDAGGASMFSTTDLPYFEGDFWPNTIEDLVSQMDEEEKTRRKDFNSDEFSDGYLEDSDYGGGSNSVGDKKAVKANKKSKSKKSQFKYKKGGGNSPASDLSDRVLSTMEKHRENFFTITITPSCTSLSIEDPDPLVQCELMDGRDSFLQMAREKFWEFSSLRRTKYSSMCFLYELHVQLNERMQYNCNNCKQIVEIRYHCNQCEDYDLCVSCKDKVTHEHELVRRTPETDSDNQNSKGSAEVNKKQAFMETLKNLPHAVTCRDANCRVRNCVRMRMIVQHAKNCIHKDQRNTCSNCKQFFQICCYHAKHCSAPKCVVPYCHNIRVKLRRQSEVLWQRRRAAMVGGAAASAASGGGGGTANSSASQVTSSTAVPTVNNKNPSVSSHGVVASSSSQPTGHSHHQQQQQQQQAMMSHSSSMAQQQQNSQNMNSAPQMGASNPQSQQHQSGPNQMQGMQLQVAQQQQQQQSSPMNTQHHHPSAANMAALQQSQSVTSQQMGQSQHAQQQSQSQHAQQQMGVVISQQNANVSTYQLPPQHAQSMQNSMNSHAQQVQASSVNVNVNMVGGPGGGGNGQGSQQMVGQSPHSVQQQQVGGGSGGGSNPPQMNSSFHGQPQPAMMIQQQPQPNSVEMTQVKLGGQNSAGGYSTIQRSAIPISSGTMPMQQQQQPSVRQQQQHSFQRVPSGTTYVTPQQQQQQPHIMAATATTGPPTQRQPWQQSPQQGPGNAAAAAAMYVVQPGRPNNTSMQQMSAGKPGIVMTQIPRAMTPTQMMQNAQGGMMHPQGAVRNNPMMSMIKQGTTAPTVMGPGGHQMMANGGRNQGWQGGQPAGVRPTIQFQQQQPATAMYGPPGVQQRRFNDAGMIQQQQVPSQMMMQPAQQLSRSQQQVVAASQPGGAGPNGGQPMTRLMAPPGGGGAGHQMQQMHPQQDPTVSAAAVAQNQQHMQSGDDLSRYSEHL